MLLLVPIQNLQTVLTDFAPKSSLRELESYSCQTFVIRLKTSVSSTFFHFYCSLLGTILCSFLKQFVCMITFCLHDCNGVTLTERKHNSSLFTPLYLIRQVIYFSFGIGLRSTQHSVKLTQISCSI